MSSDSRIKRLGLDHLKNDPKELKKHIDEAVQENTKVELVATFKQLEELKRLKSSKEERDSIDDKIKVLKKQIKTIRISIENDDSQKSN